MKHSLSLAPAPHSVTESKELTDAELEAIVAGKELRELGREMEGRSGWFVPLPSKVRSRRT